MKPDHSVSITRRTFVGMAGSTAACALLGGERAAAHGATAPLHTTSRITIERYLGATRSALEELSAHENDSYYLGTPYGTIGPDRFSSDFSRWDCWHPNGNPAPNGKSYMNCTGFVVAVLEACGADCDVIGSYVDATGYDVGTKANLSRWRHFLDDHASLRTRFESKKELLSSGVLRKGDLILAEPNDWSVPNADDHIMFFWGDSPDHDLAWHSAPSGDGIVSGKAPGNIISKITAKTADCYWLHVPLTNLIEVLLSKTSADIEISGNPGSNPSYSLAGASFSVFRSFENGELSDLAATFETDAEGHAELSLVPGEEVWLREDKPPQGFAPWSTPKRLTVGRSNPFEITVENTPCTIDLLVVKEDAETGCIAQGWGTLEGAVYELMDSNGKTHRAKTAWNEERKRWEALFRGLPRGSAKIREAVAPTGYRIDASDGDGWHALSLSPDSNDSVFVVEFGPHKESVIRGDIAGVKFGEPNGENPDSPKSPLSGCEFAIWLQDDGLLESKGYDVAPIVDAEGNPLHDESGDLCFGSLMGVVVSHEDGRFTTQDLIEEWKPSEHGGIDAPDHALPYGSYTLVELHCPDPSLALIEPIRNLEVRAQSQEVFLILEDERIASPVRIRKVDAGSGLPLLKQGTVIEVLKRQDDGTFLPIELPDRYPANEYLSSFIIGEEGFIWLPGKLPWGTYAIREKAPIPPYLLSDKLVQFTIEEGHDWNDENTIEVILENEAATGAIKGFKKNSETGKGVERAVFEIRAAYDISMPDGTKPLEAGDVAGTATTDENGLWEIKGLPLGDGLAVYEIREVSSPSGYVLDDRIHTVRLAYVDGATAEVEYALETENSPTELIVKKLDAETLEGIEGVEISVYLDEANGGDNGGERSAVAVCLTDSEGFARISNLDNDETYIVAETSARSDLGYVMSGDNLSRYLSPEGRWFETRDEYESANDWTTGKATLELEMTNDFTKIAIYKVDEETWSYLQESRQTKAISERMRLENAALLSGGTFRLLDEEGTALPVIPEESSSQEEWAFPVGGPMTFTHLPPGKRFTVQELSPPSGHMRGPETSFFIEETTDIQPIIVRNRKDRGFPKTGDNTPVVVAGLGIAAIGGTALAFRMKRLNRTEQFGRDPAERDK